MQKGALKGIGDVIKAHTTEKSIDELKASGKKRVRVVSGQRVMEIIQAIVDDTIDREVGEITKRDRDRIVSDTRERFDRVLKMQTDLEQTVADLRSELRETELERERLRADKGFLEQQLDSARKHGGEPEAVTRLGRDIDRLRESVEEIHRRVSTSDEAAIGRAVERLNARDEANARRMAAELDDVRKRIDGVSRETSRAKESTLEAILESVTDAQRRAGAELTKQLESEFGGVHERISELRERVSAAEGSDDALERLKGDLDALAERVQGAETSAEALAERVSGAIAEEMGAIRQALEASRSDAQAASADALKESEERLAERVSAESRELAGVVAGLAERISAIDERTGNAVEAVAERVAERVVIDESALTDAVARVASRVDARIDEITKAVTAAEERRAAEVETLRQDIASAASDHSVVESALAGMSDKQDARLTEAVSSLGAEWSERNDAVRRALDDGIARLDERMQAVAQHTAAVESALPERFEKVLEGALASAVGGLREELDAVGEKAAEAPSAVERSLGAVRDEMASMRDELGAITSRAVETESGLREAVQEAVSGLRAELDARAARQDEAIGALREEIAAAAAAQNAAANDGFRGALDDALDQITKVMQSATARPIDISVEATDVLLDKIFDAGDDEIRSNLDDLEVDERSGSGIAGSLGKLRALNDPSKNGKKD